MKDSLWLLVIVVYVIAWAWLEERRERRERRMEEELEVREAAAAGRLIERRFAEAGAEWEPLEEEYALRVLACSFRDVPAALEVMKQHPVRTPFAEYRLVQ